jgi:hypothetical protein
VKDQPDTGAPSGHDPRPVDRSGESLDLLGERLRAFNALRQDPERLRQWLAADDNAEAVARADIEPHLRAWFTPTDGWAAHADTTGALGPRGAGVEWRWHGSHDRDGAFNGLAATGVGVVVRGFSVLTFNTERAFKVRRYIDWAGLFTQLGLTMNWRLPAPPGAPLDEG